MFIETAASCAACHGIAVGVPSQVVPVHLWPIEQRIHITWVCVSVTVPSPLSVNRAVGADNG
jgi:hypothetical protein